MYVFMNYTYFPVTVKQCTTASFVAANTVDDSSKCTSSDEEIEVRVGFQIFTLSLMVFVGWLLLCIFLPTGMQAMPFGLVADWVQRPRPLD